MIIAALIVAAGRGSRAETPLPKQWQPLGPARVADVTEEGAVDAFYLPDLSVLDNAAQNDLRPGGPDTACDAKKRAA